MNLEFDLKTSLSVIQALEPYSGKWIYFEPLDGNNGDALITTGSISCFDALGVKRSPNPENAEIIVINGGGAMNDIWKSGLRAFKKYSSHFPQTPLIVLPSSYSFKETDFAALVGSHQAPVTLFTREAYSLKLLENLKLPDNTQLAIDHDMAFHLEETLFLRRLKTKQAEKHILIVERCDFESTTIQPETSGMTAQQKKIKLPQVIREPVKKYVKRYLNYYVRTDRNRMQIHTAFAQEMQNRVRAEYPEFSALPTYAADISANYLFSFHQFTQLIAEAAVVVTTRLHVAILAAMLGKPTYIKAGTYHKIQGVFEYSLKDRSNFYLIP